MANDLLAEIERLTITTANTDVSGPPHEHVSHPSQGNSGSLIRANGVGREGWAQKEDGHHQASITGQNMDSRWIPFSDYENHATTPPIDVPQPHTNESIMTPREVGPLQHSRYHEMSPLEEFIQNRRPSITFDSQVKLDSGHRRALDEPLSKIETQPRPTGRNKFNEMYEYAAIKSLAREQLDTEFSNYDLISGHITRRPGQHRLSDVRIQPSGSNGRWPLLQSTVDGLANARHALDLDQVASLTSESTASPVFDEVRTPPDHLAAEYVSPISSYSPFKQPKSLEDSRAWPNPWQRDYLPRTKSYTIERGPSIRRGQRQPTRTSRRSTSASIKSPATSFLSKWGREDIAPEPDNEGQEIGEYVLGRQIGFGGFSIVREAFTIERGERVCRAVKIVRKQVSGKEELENDSLQAEFEHKVNLWRCLSHRHILPLHTVYVTNFATFCIMPLHTGGTLFELIRSNRHGLRRDLARRYAYQLASAIRYLHEDVRVVHRDIKLENCLLDLSGPNAAEEGGNLLLCDFGLAEFITSDNRSPSPDPYEKATDRPTQKKIGPSETSTSVAGSLQYAAPELIQSEEPMLLNTAVDMWAFGVVTYALLVGDLPFQHSFLPRVQQMIEAGDWNRDALRTGGRDDEEVLQVVEGCLAMVSEERWTVGQVLDCAWLRGWGDVFEEGGERWKL